MLTKRDVAVTVIVGIIALACVAKGEEPKSRKFVLPGNCVKTITQDVKTGVTKVETRCEYTEAQRARMAREGN